MRDGLTGLYNRRAFDEHLEQAVAREDRQGGPLRAAAPRHRPLQEAQRHLRPPAGDAALRHTAAACCERAPAQGATRPRATAARSSRSSCPAPTRRARCTWRRACAQGVESGAARLRGRAARGHGQPGRRGVAGRRPATRRAGGRRRPRALRRQAGAAATAWWPRPALPPSRHGFAAVRDCRGLARRARSCERPTCDCRLNPAHGSIAFIVLQWIAIVFLGLMLFLALFEPSLPYRVDRAPPDPLDSTSSGGCWPRSAAAPSTRTTKIEVLTNGEVYYEAELAAIREARHSVNLEAYIFQKGEVHAPLPGGADRAGAGRRAGQPGAGRGRQLRHLAELLRGAPRGRRARGLLPPDPLVHAAAHQQPHPPRADHRGRHASASWAAPASPTTGCYDARPRQAEAALARHHVPRRRARSCATCRRPSPRTGWSPRASC